MELTIAQLEAAINFWRARQPARGDELALSAPVKTLATVYALMIFQGAGTLTLEQLDASARQLLQAWRDTDPPH